MEERAGLCPRTRGELRSAVTYWPHHEANWPAQLVAVCRKRSVTALLLDPRRLRGLDPDFVHQPVQESRCSKGGGRQ